MIKTFTCKILIANKAKCDYEMRNRIMKFMQDWQSQSTNCIIPSMQLKGETMFSFKASSLFHIYAAIFCGNDQTYNSHTW